MAPVKFVAVAPLAALTLTVVAPQPTEAASGVTVGSKATTARNQTHLLRLGKGDHQLMGLARRKAARRGCEAGAAICSRDVYDGSMWRFQGDHSSRYYPGGIMLRICTRFTISMDEGRFALGHDWEDALPDRLSVGVHSNGTCEVKVNIRKSATESSRHQTQDESVAT